MRSRSRGYKILWKKMSKNVTKHWPIWVVLCLVVFSSTLTWFLLRQHTVQAAVVRPTPVIGLQLTDNGQDAANCAHGDQNGSVTIGNVNDWTPWAGDSDNFDPDCMRVYLAGPIPLDADVRIGIQAQDVSTPCGLFNLFKCGDGGGTVAWGPWVSADTSGNTNSWTGWATDVDGWDPDQWRFIVQVAPTSWYGHGVSDFKFGIQLGDVSSGGGCTGQVGEVHNTPLLTQGGGWSSWAAGN